MIIWWLFPLIFTLVTASWIFWFLVDGRRDMALFTTFAGGWFVLAFWGVSYIAKLFTAAYLM